MMIDDHARLSKLVPVRSHISWRGERNFPYKNVET